MNDNGQQISDGLDVSQAAAGQVVTAFVLTNAVAAPILAAATSRIVRKGERRGVPWLGNVRVIAPATQLSASARTHQGRCGVAARSSTLDRTCPNVAEFAAIEGAEEFGIIWQVRLCAQYRPSLSGDQRRALMVVHRHWNRHEKR
jgi:hypothetical protein